MNTNTQNDLARLVLRVVLGLLILLHGIAKLRGGMGGIVGMVEAHGLPGVLGYGVLLGEVLGPLMLIAGFHARIGALLVAVNMLFAFALAHTGQLGQLNQQGGWALELQGMFLFSAIALALLGPGRYSVNGR
ncbi:Transcriptional regulator, GntR family [Lysobacter dokdonensis DS-58]|uniref:Transcriptional regulator, GntR family n=1 Tax=Lysobacter dokdonensis DS-58 TaxID=1300345 RepID=A0A0A2X316_9GAMM|nr:DoxX family protein [Lysobacter dokdonensis]KGQ19599.1 Transcriptional regulator, GntR family [Lysobacter dokdonensis DS-58]